MALSITAKLIITVVVLGVIGGMTATIVLLLTEEDQAYDSTTSTTSTPTTLVSTTDVGGEDLPYRVGVGIADMTGPCVDITFVSIYEALRITWFLVVPYRYLQEVCESSIDLKSLFTCCLKYSRYLCSYNYHCEMSYNLKLDMPIVGWSITAKDEMRNSL